MTTDRLSTRGMIYASLFGALTAIGALVSIPLQPVPVTLQTLFLYLAGSLLGGSLGALSQLIYLVLGVIGLPVFSGGKAGLGVFLGPTGGYLIGFVAGAFVTGKIVRWRDNPGLVWVVFAMLAAPAATARLLAHSVRRTMVCAFLIALLAGVVALLLSSVVRFSVSGLAALLASGSYFVGRGYVWLTERQVAHSSHQGGVSA